MPNRTNQLNINKRLGRKKFRTECGELSLFTQVSESNDSDAQFNHVVCLTLGFDND